MHIKNTFFLYFRSRSNSSSNRATKEEQDFNEDKFSSRRNRSHKPYDRVSHAELATSYSSSYNFYDTCMVSIINVEEINITQLIKMPSFELLNKKTLKTCRVKQIIDYLKYEH